MLKHDKINTMRGERLPMPKQNLMGFPQVRIETASFSMFQFHFTPLTNYQHFWVKLSWLTFLCNAISFHYVHYQIICIGVHSIGFLFNALIARD